MTSGFEAFQIFHAINLHFNTPSYDYFKYKGKSNANHNMWYARNDKYHFEVLGSKYKTDQLIGIFVSYFISNPNSKPWGSDLVNWAKHDYLRWLGSIESMPTTFENDLTYLKYNHKSLSSLLTSSKSNVPEILHIVLQKKINIATLIIILDIVNGAKKKLYECDEEFLWPDFVNRLEKYKPFINFDKEKYVNIFKKVFLC